MKLLSMVKKTRVLEGLSICLLSLSMAGCYAALAYAPSLLQAGAGAIAGLEDVDVKSSVAKGSDLKMIKRMAVVLGSSSTTTQQQINVWGSSDLTEVMSDNLVLELMNMGYELVERSSLEKVLSEQKLQMSGLSDPETAAKVGKILNVDAIVLGSVTTSQEMKISGGFMGIGAGTTAKSVVSNATMKIVDIKKGNIAMIVTLSYKKGQPPTEAAKTMAIALAEKLKNPSEQKASEK